MIKSITAAINATVHANTAQIILDDLKIIAYSSSYKNNESFDAILSELVESLKFEENNENFPSGPFFVAHYGWSSIAQESFAFGGIYIDADGHQWGGGEYEWEKLETLSYEAQKARITVSLEENYLERAREENNTEALNKAYNKECDFSIGLVF